jgi:cytochrome c-type biogenesis protein CcmF
VPGLIAYTFAAFVGATIVLEFVRGTRARKALGAASWPGAFSSLIARNRRRYGGYVVHAAIVLFAIGVAGSSAFDSVADAKLERGQTMAIAGYRLTYESLDERLAANATEIRASLRVARGDRDLGTLEAGKNAYTIEQQVSNEVGIRSDPLTGEDLFVIAEQIDPDGTVHFRVFVKPLVNLIWIAGLVFLLGSLIALWPDAREQRRLVERTREIGVPASR